jgi:lysozyme family protein
MTPPDFARAYRFTRSHEGGYSKPRLGDPNPTLWGVTQHAYDTYREQTGQPIRPVRQMTELECRAVYEDYWTQSKAPLMPTSEVALLVFDMFFNSPPRESHKMLQRVVGVTPDGAIGPDTLKAVHAAAEADHKALLVRLTGARATRYRKLAENDPAGLGVNLRGWLARVTAIQREVGV